MNTADDFVAFIKWVRDDEPAEQADAPEPQRDDVEIADRNRLTDPYGWTAPSRAERR